MSDDTNRLDRRSFVKAGLGAAAAAAAALGPGCRGPEGPDQVPARINGMPTVRLPRGGLVTPRFGFGGSATSGYGIPGFARPPVEERAAMVRHAFDAGVRYFDTAPNYQTEEAMGIALEDVRDQVFISTKTLARDRATARQTMEDSLRLLRTDAVDCVKLHMPNDYDVAMTVLDELETMRGEGKTRFVGMSNHLHFEVAYRLIDSGRLDDVLLARCYFPVGFFMIISQRNAEFRDMAIARAHELGMNVIGMKALGAYLYGHHARLRAPGFDERKLAALPGAAIRWSLADERFHLYVIGISMPSDIDANVAILSSDMTVTNADRMLLAEFSKELWSEEHIKQFEEPYKTPEDNYFDGDWTGRWPRVWGGPPA